MNKYSQSPDRMKALQALRDDGSADAIYGLLRRFGMMYDKTIEDEQEKDYVFEMLLDKGVSIIPSVQKYLFSAESISWPLRLLDKVADKEKELEVLQTVLDRHEPGYERDPTKKIQLMNHLGALKDKRIPRMVLPYLGDMDEGVRYAAVEALVRHGDEEAAREPLLKHFVSSSEDSLRIRIQIAEGLLELGWLVKGYRGEVEKLLPEQFQLDREGHVKRKPDGNRPEGNRPEGKRPEGKRKDT
ncbi:MAG TPA: HEAT repeat domain-containing protein [Polyangia bacterium]|nr:HEAT repeat domain-containing protein [Polyangia bacterium]